MKTKNEYKHLSISERGLVIACLSAVVGLVGCQQGTEEKAEQKIDRAAENAEQKIDESTERASEKLENTKEAVDDRAEAAKDRIEDSTDATKENLDYAEKKIDETGEKTKDNVDQTAEKTSENINESKESVSTKAQSAENVINDSVITTKIKTAILADPLLKSSQIRVTTVGGVVSLSGAVDSQQSIERALQIARTDKDVKSVENNLVVNSVPDKM